MLLFASLEHDIATAALHVLEARVSGAGRWGGTGECKEEGNKEDKELSGMERGR